jgi:hypothetical protein
VGRLVAHACAIGLHIAEVGDCTPGLVDEFDADLWMVWDGREVFVSRGTGGYAEALEDA